MAPEYYDNLKHHTSWAKIWWQFIWDPRFSLFSRVERVGDGKVGVVRTAKKAA
jgi:sphingolipid delta-4 desaturase